MKLRIALGIVLFGLSTTALCGFTTTGAAQQPSASASSCPRGSKPAVIGGTFKCLAVGKACAAKYQAAYRKYGLRCVGGKLRRRSSPLPKPVPPPAQPGHYKGLTSQNETFEFDVMPDGRGIQGVKTGQINEGCTPSATISENRYDFGTRIFPISTDASFAIDYSEQNIIGFGDGTSAPTTNRLIVTGHLSGAVGTGNLQLTTGFIYGGRSFSCGSGLQIWTVTRTG